jgi:hypothetical protein
MTRFSLYTWFLTRRARKAAMVESGSIDHDFTLRNLVNAPLTYCVLMVSELWTVMKSRLT